MDLTYVDAKNLKDLEGYAVSLAMGILSLSTLEKFHIRAVEIGILPEDLSCRSNTIVWDLRRLMKLYQDQLEGVLELVPDDFNAQTIIASLQQAELKKARQMTRKKKETKCDT